MNNILEILKEERDIYYIENVNINYSFDSLKDLCYQNNIKFDSGDILVVDNEKKTKRKVFIVTKYGAIIIYGSLSKNNIFTPFNKNIKLNNILCPKKI